MPDICSLFAGIGGVDLGFMQAGFEIAWANEMDDAACKTYRHNFKDTNLVQGNIKNISADSIPDFDVLTAGFPCQPFSIAGLQKGFKDRDGNLFFEISRIIDTKRPKTRRKRINRYTNQLDVDIYFLFVSRFVLWRNARLNVYVPNKTFV